MELKTISDYQEAFRQLLRDAEETLGCNISEVTVTHGKESWASDMWGNPINRERYDCTIFIE